MAKIAINGFGRIGRLFLRQAYDKEDIEIVAINDLGDCENLAYLLKYDSVYRKYNKKVEVKNNNIVIEGKEIKFFQEKDPSKLPWKDLGVDIVVESTGVFNEYNKAKAHINAGAKRVVITAPAKDDGVEGATVLMGVNEGDLEKVVLTSNGSCTTNAASPIIQVLTEELGIEKAILNTIHGYTATQSLVDGVSKKPRKGRAAAQNIIPSTTGAAIAVTKAIPELDGKFDGIALRVPVIVGSIADITFISKRETSVEEINGILKKAASSPRWEGIMTTTEDPIVSSDIIGEPYGAIADLSFTKVVDGNLVKVLSWYDNEFGYVSTLIKHVINVTSLI
ncbi:MAG: type I glyceraldehyde-3-phosphate dehydrogenase [Candidatus Paceibacterota bacterium]